MGKKEFLPHFSSLLTRRYVTTTATAAPGSVPAGFPKEQSRRAGARPEPALLHGEQKPGWIGSHRPREAQMSARLGLVGTPGHLQADWAVEDFVLCGQFPCHLNFK